MDEIKKIHCIECGFAVEFCICGIKPIRSDDEIDTDAEREYQRTITDEKKGVPGWQKKDFRDPVFHRTVWAWIKQKVFSPAGSYVDSKINLAIGIGVKELIRKFSFWALLFLGVVAIIITIKMF